MPSWGNILKRIEAGEMEKAPPHVTALNLYAGKLTVLEPGRILICGSLYLAGHVLSENG